MAVIEELPGVKVTIIVNGHLAQEYDDPDGPSDDANVKMARHSGYCYIESQDDAPFSIVYEIDNTRGEIPRHYEALSFCVYVDGAPVGRYHSWEAADHHRGGSVWREQRDGFRVHSSQTGMDSFFKFKFSKVTTVDDSDKSRVSREMEASKSLGTIQVFVKNSVPSSQMRNPSKKCYLPKEQALLKNFVLAEKALKGRAVSHGISYSDSGLIPQSLGTAIKFKEKNPILAFNFKYRSREALKKELIIPRSPSPQGVDGMSEAEIRRLAAEHLEDMKNGRRSATMKREAKGPLIKREYAEFYDLTENPSKREWKKIKVDDTHEAIDLTDD